MASERVGRRESRCFRLLERQRREMRVGRKGRGFSCLIISHWREVFFLSDTVTKKGAVCSVNRLLRLLSLLFLLGVLWFLVLWDVCIMYAIMRVNRGPRVSFFSFSLSLPFSSQYITRHINQL